MINSIAIRVLCVLVGPTMIQAQCKLGIKAKHSDLTDTAQELAAQGDWKGARDLITKNLRACQPSQEGASCRKLNNFTIGYLAQREALDCNLPDAERLDLLGQALNSYKNSLTDPPADGPTLNNLAVVEEELGNGSEATHAWQQASEADPGSAWLYALRLGDLYLKENRLKEARSQYEHAETLSPDASGPRERLVETYRKATDAELRQLGPALFQMEGLFSRVARNGYELIMAREYKEQPAEADQALIRWTIVTARQGWLSADSLDALPQDWTAPSITELRKFWENPTSSSPPWHWWLANDELRHEVLDVALVAGRQLVNNQQPEDAIRCWETALQFAKNLRGNGPAVPPGVPSIPSALVIQGELELVHFQNRKLKGGFRDFMQMLKGYEYAVNDENLPEVQEYHTLLGMIFAAEDKWVIGAIPLPLPELGMGVERWGAIAELGAALKVADKREQKDGFYQPLPEIKARLAEGFQAKKRRGDAQQMFLKAAAAYLDADSLSDSTKMLDGYKDAGGSGNEATILNELIGYRDSLPTDMPSEDKEPWLFRASSGVDEPFLSRQRFKVYADLATNESLNRSRRLECALQAYNLAVKLHISLVGAADLLRWEKITATLLEIANIQPPPVRPLQGAELATTQRDKLATFSFPGDLEPLGVILNRETQTAAAIVTAVGPTDALVLKDHILVRNGQVFFPEASLPAEVNSILRRLESSGAVHVNTGATSPMAEVKDAPEPAEIGLPENTPKS